MFRCQNQEKICNNTITKDPTTFQVYVTRNSSGDEIANVNFLHDDIVHALNYATYRLPNSVK